MKRIQFRKTFPYDPTQNGRYSRYIGYTKLMLQQSSVGISSCILLELPSLTSLIYCSMAQRAYETASAISQKDTKSVITKTNLLDEISFNLRDLLSCDEFNTFGSNLVRKRFVEAFIKDKLRESRSSLKQRIEQVYEIITSLKDGNYLFISHSFFMKLVQVYVQHSDLFSRPTILQENFDVTKKTFQFGHGFNFGI